MKNIKSSNKAQKRRFSSCPLHCSSAKLHLKRAATHKILNTKKMSPKPQRRKKKKTLLEKVKSIIALLTLLKKGWEIIIYFLEQWKGS